MNAMLKEVVVRSFMWNGMQSDQNVALSGGDPRRWRGRFVVLVKVAVTGVSLWYIGRMIDPRALQHDLATMSLPFLGLSFACFLMIGILGGARWWVVLRAMGQPSRLSALTALFWTGMLLNQILPSAAGDSARVWLSVRRGVPLSASVHSIFLERILMVLVLLLIVLVTQPLLSYVAPGASEPLWVPVVFLIGGLGGLGLLAVADRISARFASTHAGILHWLAGLSRDTRCVVASRWTAPLAILCLVGNLNFVVAGGLLGAALGLRLPFADYLAFIPLVVAVTVIPISIAGWGLREGLLIALLAKVGISHEAALAFSVMFGAFSAFCSLPGLALWWKDSEQRRTSGVAGRGTNGPPAGLEATVCRRDRRSSRPGCRQMKSTLGISRHQRKR